MAVTGCAPILPPSVFGRFDRAREAATIQAAERDAPRAIGRARQLREQAQEAFESGDFAGAQILAEQALAANEIAIAIGRSARATARAMQATQQTTKQQQAVARMDAEQQKTLAEVRALDTKIKAAQAGAKIKPSATAKGAHERARRQAVVALGFEGKLLCEAARLLDGVVGKRASHQRPADFAAAQQAMDAFQGRAAKDAAAPIDEALRLRARCLALLDSVRDVAGASAKDAKDSGGADALLARLSRQALGQPRRDERGVVATLADPFQKAVLKPSAQKLLGKLAAVAHRHPSFPLLVVLHHAQGEAGAALHEKRVGALRTALKRHALQAAEVIDVGQALPRVEPGKLGAARNRRVELVFVAP